MILISYKPRSILVKELFVSKLVGPNYLYNTNYNKNGPLKNICKQLTNYNFKQVNITLKINSTKTGFEQQ